MRRASLLAVACVACGHAAPRTSDRTAATTIKYAVITVDRPSGEGTLTIAADGTRTSHFTFNDRGRGPDTTAVATFDAAGEPTSIDIKGHAYEKQPVDEHLETSGGEHRWRSTSEQGHAPVGASYVPINDPLATQAPMLRALRAAPGHRIKLLPAGEAWIEDDAAVEVGGRRLHHVAIAGFGFTPSLAWFDDDGELFAAVNSWFSIIRAGDEPLVPALIAKDNEWLAARAARLAKTLAHRPPAAGLAITHANVFDAEARRIVADRTVIVAGDRIAAVGDASTAIPPGAQVIDARGRTLIPGLWDMHVHLQDGDGLLDLAFGVTTVRDLGNTIDELGARVKRFDDGSELGPHVLRAGLVDGPGKLAAPTGILVSNPDEAKAAVARYAELGYPQLKIYSSVPPELVPVLAAAAHARGMRVSGHVPNKMRASDAIAAGYDEIQHANFLMLQFLAGPDDDTRTPLRFTRVAEKGAALDLDGKDVQAFLDLLVAHKTVIDPTVSTFEGLFTTNPGDVDPGLRPYLDRLPAQYARSARSGGLDAPGDQRAVFRASYAKMLELVVRAWKRGVTVVAGTDAGAGMYLSRELELYVQGGIPAADALAIATIGSARVMKRDRDTGSIAPGKQADLVLLDGDPTQDISVVRNADVVICRGVVYDPAELFGAIGMRPRAAATAAGALDDAQVIAMSHAFLDAYDRADADAFTAPMGPTFSLFEDARFMDKGQFVKNIEARHARNAPLRSRTWQDEHVRRSADVAIFVGEAIEHIPAEGDHAAGTYDGYNTLVWVKDGAQWKVAHWQWARAGLEAERDRWNDTFRAGVGFNVKPNALLVETVKGRKPGAALDLAMGQGRNAVFLATQGWKVTGVDISDVGMAIAQQKAAEQHVKLTTVNADMDHYDLGKNKWDLVTMIYAGNDYDLVAKIQPSLKKGGLFVTEYFEKTSDAAQTGADGWDAAELAKRFGAGWKILRNDTVEDVADYSLRPQKLVRFVAQKL